MVHPGANAGALTAQLPPRSPGADGLADPEPRAGALGWGTAGRVPTRYRAGDDEQQVQIALAGMLAELVTQGVATHERIEGIVGCSSPAPTKSVDEADIRDLAKFI